MTNPAVSHGGKGVHGKVKNWTARVDHLAYRIFNFFPIREVIVVQQDVTVLLGQILEYGPKRALLFEGERFKSMSSLDIAP